MLTDFFRSPFTLERYRSGLIGPHLDSFTEWLNDRGHQRISIRRHVREVVHFAAWAKTAGIPVEGLNQAALDQLHIFLDHREPLRPRNGGDQHLCQSAGIFVRFFEATGVVCGLAPSAATPSPAERVWTEFTEWMRAQRGTMSSTLSGYRRPISALLQNLGTDPSAFSAEGLRHFLLQQVKLSSQEQSKNLATALRMFLRFLIACGDCPVGLDCAIPTVARWRLAALPIYLPAHEVERLIQSDPVLRSGVDAGCARSRNPPVDSTPRLAGGRRQRVEVWRSSLVGGGTRRFGQEPPRGAASATPGCRRCDSALSAPMSAASIERTRLHHRRCTVRSHIPSGRWPFGPPRVASHRYQCANRGGTSVAAFGGD